jgi:hypothetical protein
VTLIGIYRRGIAVEKLWEMSDCQLALEENLARYGAVVGDQIPEWDDDNRAECVSCNWKGTAGEAEDDDDEG